MKRSILSGITLLGILMLSLPALGSPVDGLQKVGSTRLKVMFWTIYDSVLYSPDGVYDTVEPGLALEITYRRKISAGDLINRTESEWQDLELEHSGREGWLARLQVIWPDVEPGDTLTLLVDDGLGSNFYFNERFIGSLDDADFTRHFLAIWLDPDSRFPRQRAALTGSAD